MATIARPQPPSVRTTRILYVSLAILCLLIVFLGFSRTFYLNSFFAHRNLSTLRIVHGVVFSGWLVLLLAQVSLVAIRRTDLHRRLGVFGGFLAASMLGLGLALAIEAGRNGFQNPGLPPPLIFLIIPFFDMVIFSSLVGLGFVWRRRPELHKRLMILATIAILPPAFARFPVAIITRTLPFSGFLLADLVLLACVVYDYRISRRLHPVWLWAGLAVVLSFPLRLALGGTQAWLHFAQWLTR